MAIRNVCFFVGLCLLLGGLPVYAVDQSVCKEGSMVNYYGDGSLRSCVLKDNYDANDIKCKANNTIKLYNSGNLQACILYKTSIINSNKCKGNSLITFYEDGTLLECSKMKYRF
ncbi:MAG: hypothetical protein ABSB79_12295 [Syntrophales bacterium]|jgi:antitoxin component YwqK of YwqJK toxin-antitoxin module